MNTIKWIENYLQNDCIQFVQINGKESSSLPVTSGIPQGSVLGPLLFVIYINDLPDKIKSTVYMYADDTKLYREIKSSDDNDILQADLCEMQAWSDKWLLKFHPDKCFCLTIGKEEVADFSYNITSDNKVYNMKNVDKMKDIGVIMDDELKFDKHINGKIETANKILGIIRRLICF